MLGAPAVVLHYRMERKLATVLFVDLVDSTSLVTGTDPEVVRRRVKRFFEQSRAASTQHGGIVEKFAGDAVMAAFGVPLAHEDDAERATRAALEIARRSRARPPGSDRDRGRRARRRGRRVDLRHRRGREPRRAAAAGRAAGRDPRRADGVPARGGQPRRRGAGALELKGIAGAAPRVAVVDALDGPGRPLGPRAPLVGREPSWSCSRTLRAGGARPACAPLHDLRRAGRRQEPARARVSTASSARASHRAR